MLCGKLIQSANSLLYGLTNFEFIVVFLVIYQYLSHLAGIPVKLQNSSLDILKAYLWTSETIISCSHADFGGGSRFYVHSVTYLVVVDTWYV